MARVIHTAHRTMRATLSCGHELSDPAAVLALGEVIACPDCIAVCGAHMALELQLQNREPTEEADVSLSAMGFAYGQPF